MDHIDAMEDLKKGIHLRSYAQRDPVVAFRVESYDMFDEMTREIREDTAKMMLTLMPVHKSDVQRKAVAHVTSTSDDKNENVKAVTVRKEKKIGPMTHVRAEAVLSIRSAADHPLNLPPRLLRLRKSTSRKRSASDLKSKNE